MPSKRANGEAAMISSIMAWFVPDNMERLP
jgi:hypothetical protein